MEGLRGKGRILFPQHFHREAESGAEYPNFIIVIAIITGITIIIIINNIMINNTVIGISSIVINLVPRRVGENPGNEVASSSSTILYFISPSNSYSLLRRMKIVSVHCVFKFIS